MMNKNIALKTAGGLTLTLMFGLVAGCAAHENATAPQELKPVNLQTDMAAGTDAAPGEVAKVAYAALDKNCASCHGAGQRMNRKVPVDPASYQKLIDKKLVVPGKPDESELYTVLLDKDNPMPPPNARQRPSAEEIEAIRLWIEKGAPAPQS
jgi:mono/diheme cytochrome c family protein